MAWGVVSFAELPAYFGSENLRVGERMGRRTPSLTGLEMTCGSGLLLAAPDRDAVLTGMGTTGKVVGATWGAASAKCTKF